MDRRVFISTLMGLPLVSSAQAGVPWKAEFVMGGFDGKAYAAGLYIKMEKGWKTYWRNPGEAGIPPTINMTGQNIGNFKFDFPLPLRIRDASGESLAFHDDVLLPIMLLPKEKSEPITAHLSAFFGVCAEVCTPAKFEAEARFDTNNARSALITQWQMRVPLAAKFVTFAHVENRNLILEINQPLEDIFIEGPGNLYFRKPDFSKQAGKAWIEVNGLKSPQDLMGKGLRITADANGQGLEQNVIVA